MIYHININPMYNNIMPELPEVETTRQGIHPYLINQTIDHIVVRNAQLRWTVSPALSELHGAKIKDIQRRAKYLLVELSDNIGWIIIHLGMSGSLRIIQHQSQTIKKHDHIDLILTSGTILRYTDPRRFGAWLFTQQLDNLPLLKSLAPEPLTQAFNSEYLKQKLINKSQPIKNAIMDNHIVVGVGNIYASESLFMAKINPFMPSKNLSLTHINKLVDSIKIVLDNAIKQGGTTLKDFTNVDGKPGYFANELLVYGRKNEPCFMCGNLLESAVIGQRNTFYCRKCQKVPNKKIKH